MVSGKPHLMADLCASENPGQIINLIAYFVQISIVLTSNNRSPEPKSVNCHSNDNGHQGFLERQILEGTLEQ